MSSEAHFETPENVRISYQMAGPGTRFVAWVLDQLIVYLILLVVGIPLLFVFAAAFDVVERKISSAKSPEEATQLALLYGIGIFLLFWSLGSLFYFGLSELLLRGQTFGKRATRIRVVKSDGFALDATSILIRTFFRVVDHLPPLWIVPVFAPRWQRFGDMVAGTIVVQETKDELGNVRELAKRNYVDSKFRFDVVALARARREDVEAVSRVLDRWSALSTTQRDALLDRIVPSLAARLQVEPPAKEDRIQFLEDFLAAEYRRQHRKLG